MDPDAQTNDSEEPVRLDKSRSVTSEEQSQENREQTPHPLTLTRLYYSVMDDDIPDEVFIHSSSPPSRLDPEGGSTCQAAATSPSVSPRSSDVTAANTNPECLDRHHGERQVMATHSQVNEEVENAMSVHGDGVRRDSSGEAQSIGRDLTSMEDSATQDSEGEVEEILGKLQDRMVDLKLSKEDGDLAETGLTHGCLNLERNNPACLKDLKNVTEGNQSKMEAVLIQSTDSSEEEGIDSELEDVGSYDSELKEMTQVKRKSVEDVVEVVNVEHRQLDSPEDESTERRKDSRIATDILQGQDLLQRLQLVQQRQDLTEISLTASKLEGESIRTDFASREDPETPQEQEQTEQEANLETSTSVATDYFEHCSDSKTKENSSDEESETGNFVNQTGACADDSVCKISEEDMPESESRAKHVVVEDVGLENELCEAEEAAGDEQALGGENNDSCNEDDRPEEQGRASLSPRNVERKASGIGETDSWLNENVPIFPSCHRLSAAETHTEKLFQEASQIKRDLQRAEGVLDLSDNPDILEIPFKSSISLETLRAGDESVQSAEWHFSEQQMQKEISQELQRELVLVNLGKIPGGYSKGESRHMKDTKLLFEEFQQDKMEGPTRIRKPQASVAKSPIYPSVLERTRSLEMFSHKTSTMLRTHSFRLVPPNEKELHLEPFRPQSPVLRDKTRLSPYPTHEKLPRMHKSMDSINAGSATAPVDRVKKSKEDAVREGSPLLRENPFFKLRPALSLQPEVEKDIREAKKREEELRRQRSNLYGEVRQVSREDGKSAAQLKNDPRQKTTGRLERVWPPPSKKDQTKAEQQEARVQRAPGHKAALWQRWESGLINGQSPSSSSGGGNNNNTG